MVVLSMMTGWLSLPFRSPKLKEDLAVDDVPAVESTL